MGIKISKDHLHPSVIESITSLIGDLSQLETTAKGNAVEAINELLANGGNKEELEALIAEIAEGKELIANAVGEPLTAEESFEEMSSDINSLLSTFKTNMMKNGITVESSDRFKSLIDKIATMVEEGSNKGIQYTSGVSTVSVPGEATTVTIPFNETLNYIPNIVFVRVKYYNGSSVYFDGWLSNNQSLSLNVSGYGIAKLTVDNVTEEQLRVDVYTGNTNYLFLNTSSSSKNIDFSWYAIGVGEEDTTLRDSLADILENKGVDVTEEDDMASLITKVEQKLDESSNYLLKNGGDPSIYTINYDYASGDATATHKTNYLQFSTSGSNYQSAFAFFTLKEEIDLTDKTMIMFDLEINGTTRYTYFAYGVYKGTLDNNTTFVKGNMQNDAIDYESKLYEKRAKYIIDVSDCTGVHKIGLRIGAYGFYSSTLNLYNIEIV